jgi:regulatory protein
MKPPDGPAARQSAMRRLLGMLARKGYPAGLAMTVIREELAASDDELPIVNESGLEPDEPTFDV